MEGTVGSGFDVFVWGDVQVRVEFETECESVSWKGAEGKGRGKVQLRLRKKGEERVVEEEADFVVGADGVNSKVLGCASACARASLVFSLPLVLSRRVCTRTCSACPAYVCVRAS